MRYISPLKGCPLRIIEENEQTIKLEIREGTAGISREIQKNKVSSIKDLQTLKEKWDRYKEMNVIPLWKAIDYAGVMYIDWCVRAISELMKNHSNQDNDMKKWICHLLNEDTKIIDDALAAIN